MDADRNAEAALPHVRAALRWQARIDAADVAARAGLMPRDVDTALAVLGSRGLVGFDLAAGAYYHRELPFDMDRVEALHPRLLEARKLVDEQHVCLVSQGGSGDELRAEAYVQGTEVRHRVRLLPDGDRCTCLWYGKHQGDRGPCKHVLAVRILLTREEE